MQSPPSAGDVKSKISAVKIHIRFNQFSLRAAKEASKQKFLIPIW
jgi:hypothetical protein